MKGIRKPAYLKAEAAAEWGRITGAMGESMQAVHFGMIVQACVYWQNFCAAQRAVATKGRSAKTSNGNIITHPEFAAMNTAFTNYQKAMRQLRLTPQTAAAESEADRAGREAERFAKGY